MDHIELKREKQFIEFSEKCEEFNKSNQDLNQFQRLDGYKKIYKSVYLSGYIDATVDDVINAMGSDSISNP